MREHSEIRLFTPQSEEDFVFSLYGTYTEGLRVEGQTKVQKPKPSFKEGFYGAVDAILVYCIDKG